MGKTIRNYNGDGLKAIKKQKPKKKSKFRVREFYEDDDFNDADQRDEDYLQTDND